MKKIYFVIILAFFAVFSYANDINEVPNDHIYLEGNASRADHNEFFQTNFRMEAMSLGYTIAEKKNDAGYIYRYNVVPNMVMYSDGVQRLAPPDEPQYILQISVVRNTDNSELLSFNFPFTDLDEMYEYNQYIFFRAAVNIPPAEGTSSSQSTKAAVANAVAKVIDTSWKDKWIYFRASFDYPITFYTLQPNGLYEGKSLWNGSDIKNPDSFSIPLNHRVNALPGATVGVEIQFLNFMSVEFSFQVNFGDTVDNKFINMAAGAQLKFPLKFVNSLVIEPYGAFTYPLKKSEIFNSFPPYDVGGGVQICTKGGKNGAFFIDVNYMFSLENAAMNNLYKVKGSNDDTAYLFKNPKDVNYKRFVIGLGVGYKFGLINRKK